MPVKFDGAAASEAFAGSDLFCDIVEKGRAGMGIGINKDKPIAGRGGGTAISGAGNLVDGFEDDFGSGSTGDFSGFVGGIIVADDEFSLPAAAVKRGECGVDVAQGFAKALFFVESRDDGRDSQVSLNENMPEIRRERKSETQADRASNFEQEGTKREARK